MLPQIFEGVFGRAVWWVLYMWRESCFLLLVWMFMGYTARDGERCIDWLLIWIRINYRQSDAQEFLIPSYFYFVWFLEGPCIEMFNCRGFRAWCVCWYFCWWCVPFYCQKLRCIRCRRTCQLIGVPCFWGQGKCVHIVLRWVGCFEEVKQCGGNRWYVRLAYGCLADLLRLFCSHMECLIKKNVPMFQSPLPQDCLHVYVW